MQINLAKDAHIIYAQDAQMIRPIHCYRSGATLMSRLFFCSTMRDAILSEWLVLCEPLQLRLGTLLEQKF